MSVTACLTTKNDKYYVIIGWHEADKRKQKWINTGLSVSGNNKRKAEQKRLELQREWEDKVSLNNFKSILFSDYLKQWLDETKHTIGETTYWSYRNTIYSSICPYFDERKILLADLKTYHIQEFYNYKMNVDGVTGNTICHYHANISKALKYAVKTERIKNNPAANVELPKKQKHVADYYTADELRKVIEGAKNTPLETPVMLAAWFGLRRGEIVGLKWDCIDFDACTLSVLGTMKDKGEHGVRLEGQWYEETAKTDSSLRTFPMHPSAVEYFRKLKQKQDENKKDPEYIHKWDEFVCVRDNGVILRLEYVSREFPKLCEKCGLRRLGIHELRHSNISLLLENGASMKELQEWAGHGSYSTTANIYSHIQAKSKLKMSDSLEKALC